MFQKLRIPSRLGSIAAVFGALLAVLAVHVEQHRLRHAAHPERHAATASVLASAPRAGAVR